MIQGNLSNVLFCAFDQKEVLRRYTLYYTNEEGEIVEIRDGNEPTRLNINY